MIRPSLKSLFLLALPLCLNFLNLACGSLGVSGATLNTQGFAVGEATNQDAGKSSAGPGMPNSNFSPAGDFPAAMPEDSAPASGPVVAANGSVPGSQITDPGMTGLVIILLKYDGAVTLSGASVPENNCSENGFNNSLKVNLWVKDKNQAWSSPTNIPVDSCGKFSSFGSIVNAYCPDDNQSCIKFVATYDLMGETLEAEMEIPSENEFKYWDHHIAIRLPNLKSSEIHPGSHKPPPEFDFDGPTLPIQALNPQNLPKEKTWDFSNSASLPSRNIK